eukprot:140850-Pyramimonas_sp.AAC.1
MTWNCRRQSRTASWGVSTSRKLSESTSWSILKSRRSPRRHIGSSLMFCKLLGRHMWHMLTKLASYTGASLWYFENSHMELEHPWS